jgi:hypothetical protein
VKKIAMRSLLSEAEKKKILEDVTRKVTPEVTLKVDVTAVLNVMETLHLSYEDAVSALKIPAERQAAVLKKVLEQKQND